MVTVQGVWLICNSWVSPFSLQLRSGVGACVLKWIMTSLWVILYNYCQVIASLGSKTYWLFFLYPKFIDLFFWIPHFTKSSPACHIVQGLLKGGHNVGLKKTIHIIYRYISILYGQWFEKSKKMCPSLTLKSKKEWPQDSFQFINTSNLSNIYSRSL